MELRILLAGLRELAFLDSLEDKKTLCIVQDRSIGVKRTRLLPRSRAAQDWNSRQILDTHKSQYFFNRILHDYREESKDESIYERMRYYLPMMSLEEPFYIPFKHFPWKIKYREDTESFKKRFIDYFERSEKSLE